MEILQLEQEIEILAYQVLNIDCKVGIAVLKDDQWRRGRLALAKVLRPEDGALDAARMKFPNTHYSLSHCGSKSIAISANSDTISGIGIDFEQAFPSYKSRRNFLSSEEDDALDRSQPEEAFYLQKLWTIKEAAFKADPCNHGNTLRDYPILTPEAIQGRIQTASHFISYCFLQIQGASLSVAISHKKY